MGQMIDNTKKETINKSTSIPSATKETINKTIIKSTSITSTAREEKDINLDDLLDFNSQILVKGLIYSEIYGLPKSKRRGR